MIEARYLAAVSSIDGTGRCGRVDSNRSVEEWGHRQLVSRAAECPRGWTDSQERKERNVQVLPAPAAVSDRRGVDMLKLRREEERAVKVVVVLVAVVIVR